MAKRNLFEELREGIEEIKSNRQGKITLRAYDVKLRPLPKITATSIRNIRRKLHLSRNVFAMRLRVSPRTLEKWEQGKTVPNSQAAALLLMVKKYPETLDRLANI
ncbi:MAG: helix-turn-helix domain-containing protein [Pseudomonadota bacterium]